MYVTNIDIMYLGITYGYNIGIKYGYNRYNRYMYKI